MHSAGRKLGKLMNFLFVFLFLGILTLKGSCESLLLSVLDTAVVDSHLSLACIFDIIQFLSQTPNSSPILQFSDTKWASNNAIQF